jgi:hypothetical protein
MVFGDFFAGTFALVALLLPFTLFVAMAGAWLAAAWAMAKSP